MCAVSARWIVHVNAVCNALCCYSIIHSIHHSSSSSPSSRCVLHHSCVLSSIPFTIISQHRLSIALDAKVRASASIGIKCGNAHMIHRTYFLSASIVDDDGTQLMSIHLDSLILHRIPTWIMARLTTCHTVNGCDIMIKNNKRDQCTLFRHADYSIHYFIDDSNHISHMQIFVRTKKCCCFSHSKGSTYFVR